MSHGNLRRVHSTVLTPHCTAHSSLPFRGNENEILGREREVMTESPFRLICFQFFPLPSILATLSYLEAKRDSVPGFSYGTLTWIPRCELRGWLLSTPVHTHTLRCSWIEGLPCPRVPHLTCGCSACESEFGGVGRPFLQFSSTYSLAGGCFGHKAA